MKKPLIIAASAFIAASLTFTQQYAFTSGVHSDDVFYPGNTNNVPNASTNAYAAFKLVDQFVDIGFTATFRATGPNSGTVVFWVAKSFAGLDDFETVPSLFVSAPADGTNLVVANGVFHCPSETYLQIVAIENPGGSSITNITARWNLKSPKFGATQATQ